MTKPDQSFPGGLKGCCRFMVGKSDYLFFWLSWSKRPTKRKIILTFPPPTERSWIPQQLPTNPTEMMHLLPNIKTESNKWKIKPWTKDYINSLLPILPPTSPHLANMAQFFRTPRFCKVSAASQVKRWRFSSRSICRSLWLTNLLTATPSLAKPPCRLEHLVHHITQSHAKRRVFSC